MKKIYSSIALFWIPFCGIAQQNAPICGSDNANREALMQNPEVLQSQIELETFTENFIALKQQKVKKSLVVEPEYVVPVVFHIIHNYGDENISDEQVKEAIVILNRDYAKENADISDVVPEFQNIIGKTNIKFRLATKDPMGNCTNGIEHIYSFKTSVGDDNAKLNPWQRSQYLNIWVVKNIPSKGAGRTLGYSYYPSAVNVSGVFSSKDGVIMVWDAVGNSLSGNSDFSRTLTHEVGHWLNLKHPWGDNNAPGIACGDDEVFDTPITKGYFSICDLVNNQICTSGVVENVQNYMDYSGCSRMFSIGQTDRMEAAINAPVAGRNNLWTQANLVLTGTANPLVSPLCPPLADFHTEQTFTCAGNQIKFFDRTQRAFVDSWLWTIPGALPETSNLQNPVFTFPNPGKYTVTLKTTNPAGTTSKTLAEYITVGVSFPEHNVPYFQDFSNAEAVNNEWVKSDLFKNNHFWQHSADCGNGGALFFNNWQGENGDYDVLISPSFNLKFVNGIKLNFKYSASSYASDLKEKLEIYGSSDCGSNWKPITTIKDNAFFNGGQWNTNYVANIDQLWTSISLNLNSANFKKDNVRFKFVYTATGRGNNIWLDDFGIDGTVGIEDDENQLTNFNIYPNPNSGIWTIQFNLEKNSQPTLSVLNILGESVLNRQMESLTAGDHQLEITNQLPNGIYFVELNTGTQRATLKMVVNN